MRRCFSLTSLMLAGAVSVAAAQAPDPRARVEALARRASARLQALQREADRLAAQERTLLTELRKLELDRQMRVEELKRLDEELDGIARELGDTTLGIEELERRDLTERPGLEGRLVEMYKLGHGGYLRLLLSVDDMRQFGRAHRTVSMLARLDRERVERHRQTLAELRKARKALEARSAEMAALQQQARKARTEIERAVTARTRLVQAIDEQRDLNARLAGELQAAHDKLQQAVAAVAGGRAAEALGLPLQPFRGDLDWPVLGPITERFGRERGRFGTAINRNGIQIAAAEDTPVRAIHEGTVAFADSFIGFGNLIIVEHGDQSYSLYGHLSSLAVEKGARVDRGQTVGTVGTAPAGAPGLYFELRVDGKPVDPLQWLRRR